MKLLTRPTKLVLSKPERDTLAAAAREIENINRRFAEIGELRQTLRDAAADFVAGKTPILEALALGSFRRLDHEEAQGNLQRALKARLREILDGSADLCRRHRQHAADEAQARLEQAEAAERKHAKTLGIDDDDFRPSGNLERLAAEAFAAKESVNDSSGIRPHDFAQLLEAAGITAPTTSAVSDDD